MKKFSYNFPIGKLWIAEQQGKIFHIDMSDIPDCEEVETDLIKNTHRQLDEYFSGERKFFDIPLLLIGTDFQVKVWKALMTIPYGKTASYLDIAKLIGNPKASRAVGGANNKNNIIIVIPCHRIIGSNGDLTGYECGLDIKKYLLNLESGENNKFDAA